MVKKFASSRIFIRILVFIVMVFMSFQAMAGVCVSDKERQALNSRALQSYLMVAAISCGQQENYNNFVRTNRNYLTDQNNIITAFFNRNYNGGGKSELNNFFTFLANKSSQISLDSDSDSFCKEANAVFTKMSGSKQIAKIAAKQTFASMYQINSCTE